MIALCSGLGRVGVSDVRCSRDAPSRRSRKRKGGEEAPEHQQYFLVCERRCWPSRHVGHSNRTHPPTIRVPRRRPRLDRLRTRPSSVTAGVRGERTGRRRRRGRPGRYLDGSGEFLVGLTDGDIVAIGGFQSRGDDAAEVRRMRVHPDHRRREYGERPLAALEERARERGFARVVLDTNERLTAARKLYGKRGYEEVRRATHSITGDEFICYQKELRRANESPRSDRG